MDIKNVTGLEKPLVKLIEVVSEGLGIVGNSFFEFDAKKVKRIGEAEAEAEKKKIIKKAEGQDEALAILNRASKRFELEQYNKQVNLENIVVRTKEKLENQTVSNEPVDKDWSARFISMAQDVSREDMQDILSSILAGEIKRPGAFSLRTLDLVKNLSRDDLEIFKKFSLLASNNQLIFLPRSTANDGISDIIFREILDMIDIGLINANLSTGLKLKNVKIGEPFSLTLKNGSLIFNFTQDQSKVDLPVLKLTEAGQELCSLLDIKDHEFDKLNKYIDELTKFLLSKNLQRIQ